MKKQSRLASGTKPPRLPLGRRDAIRALLLGAFTGPALFETMTQAQSQAPPPDEGVAWVCPMHPDYTSESPGACPRCGMTLIQTKPYDVRNYKLEFHTEPAVVKAGENITLYFKFLRPGTDDVVKKFEYVHTKLFHLFVISQDMEFFEHIHPVMHPDGTWTIDTTLPKPGYYKVLCDILPSGGSSQFLAAPLVTANYSGDLVMDSAHLVPNTDPKVTAEDITATISFDPKQFASGVYGHMTYYLADSKTRRPITDLQTYLGAFGHMLIMSEDMEEYVHSHPINIINQSERESPEDIIEYIIPPDADLEKIRGGPSVTFEGLMPKPGNFRAWAQFRRNDQVRTTVFTFNVVKGSPEPFLQYQ